MKQGILIVYVDVGSVQNHIAVKMTEQMKNLFEENYSELHDNYDICYIPTPKTSSQERGTIIKLFPYEGYSGDLGMDVDVDIDEDFNDDNSILPKVNLKIPMPKVQKPKPPETRSITEDDKPNGVRDGI